MVQQWLNPQADGDITGGNALSVGITDFGPVTRGILNLKPLTILVGPNGCGKSHVATLVHSIVNAAHDQSLETIVPDSKRSFDIQTIIDEGKRIFEKYKTGINPVSSNLYKMYARHKFEKLHETLSANFDEHKSLIRTGKNRFKLDIKSNAIQGTMIGSQTVKMKPANTLRLKAHFKKQTVASLDPNEALHRDGSTVHLDLPNFIVDMPFAVSSVPTLLAAALHANRSHLGRSIYFPAERGGLTLAYRSLTLHFYDRVGLAGADSLNSDMTNVSTNFLSLLLMRADTRTEFADFAEQFEKRALDGSIIAREDAKKSLNVVFKHNHADFPLSKSASSVKDLALFLLYLKHQAQKGEMAIVEEPEITLHPHNQLLLARLIAKLVNAGLHIMVTTHSQYFLEQLSHCVMAGSQLDKDNPSFQSNERLDRNSVAAYSFKKDDDGYKMAPIAIDDEGIPQYEFISASEKLYDELLGLERDTDDS